MSLMDFKGMILCCGVLLCGRVVGGKSKDGLPLVLIDDGVNVDRVLRLAMSQC